MAQAPGRRGARERVGAIELVFPVDLVASARYGIGRAGGGSPTQGRRNTSGHAPAPRGGRARRRGIRTQHVEHALLEHNSKTINHTITIH